MKVPTYIAFFIYSIDQSLLISFIYSNRSKDGFARTVPVCGGGGREGGWRRWWRWHRRRPMSMVAVVTGGDLESFRIKIEMTRGGLLFIGSKISATVLV
jgi:hypothetical protein